MIKNKNLLFIFKGKSFAIMPQQCPISREDSNGNSHCSKDLTSDRCAYANNNNEKFNLLNAVNIFFFFGSYFYTLDAVSKSNTF